MTPGAIVVEQGSGARVGNVEFFCLSDAFYIVEGELVFEVEGEEIVAGPGTFVLVPPGVEHTFANRTDAEVKVLNIHAPAGFDKRLLEG